MIHRTDMPEHRRLLAIAHRAGNDIVRLRRAENIGADFVEADVRLYRGRLEVRHLKTMRWLPLLYDRHPWRLAAGWTHRLILGELFGALSSDTGMMVDLKGDDDALPEAILRAIREAAGGRRLIVCGQNWPLVDPFVAAPEVIAVHSIGRPDQLDAFLRSSRPTQGISIHASLLSETVISALKQRAPLVVTWPINTPGELARVSGLGVDGVTTDSLAILETVVKSSGHADATQSVPDSDAVSRA